MGLSQEDRDRAVEILKDVEASVAALPEEEQREYERCRQSILDARVWLR